MAARLVLGGKKERKISLATLEGDKAVVELARGGCVVNQTTVAAIVSGMRAEPDYFHERGFYERAAAEAKKESKQP